MFRSLASSLITLLAILIFALMLLFFWSGSENVQFARNTFEGDRSTQAILDEQRRAELQAGLAAKSETPQMVEEETPQPSTGSGEGAAVVVWISIPGFRGDYLEKSETTFLKKLAEEGAATNKMRPSFPCLTFPAHATMATGTTPDKHGIVADRIRTAAGEVQDSPTDSALLLAEPIWTTATRQGVKTLVHDWPLSQNQTGEHKAAYFLDAYDPESTDEVRLNKALEQWRADSKDAGDNKLRLVMLRLDDIFRQGRIHGPRASDTFAAVGATDKLLQTFFDTVRAEWSTLAPRDANLVVLVTTDHGLAELDKNVNIEHLLGPEMMANAEIVAHDAIANLFFKGLPENEGEKKIFIGKFDNELSKRIYFRTLKKEDLPENWAYLNPERTGDRVLVLKTGYSFADQKASEPVFAPSEGPGYSGAFGYPVEESIRMSGQIFIAGFPNSPVSGALDEVKQPTFHATVCKLLGIEPAPGAATETLPLK
ncbi:MAG TPA: alkaline phosphatase family protein [Bacteroidia bacterium]|nr:alkaline phosphatase family protein [Bacteroidia bacterium]